jgi:hypothetical protein
MTGSDARVWVGTDVESVVEIAESLERYGYRCGCRLFPLTRSRLPGV